MSPVRPIKPKSEDKVEEEEEKEQSSYYLLFDEGGQYTRTEIDSSMEILEDVMYPDGSVVLMQREQDNDLHVMKKSDRKKGQTRLEDGERVLARLSDESFVKLSVRDSNCVENDLQLVVK